MLSATSLTSIIFFQMGQQAWSDVDIIMTPVSSFDTLVNLNENQYNINPFAVEKAEPFGLPSDTAKEHHLVTNLAGFPVMNTDRIR